MRCNDEQKMETIIETVAIMQGLIKTSSIFF